MARLYVKDEALYARYHKGELDSDLDVCLKATSSDEVVKVSSSALLELSPLLGEMAKTATQSVLHIEDVSHDQLKHLVAAVYGKPLKATSSLVDMFALSHFAHKYDIAMEEALGHLVPYDCEASQVEELMQLYQSVPGKASGLQDRILSGIFRNYDKVENAEEKLAILPRHLNRWLSHLDAKPKKMLDVVRNIINQVCVYLQVSSCAL